MVFSSYVFLFYFLPFSLAIYYLLPRRAKHGALTLVSYGFYGWANPAFVPLMLVSTIIDYFAGRVQAHSGLRGWRQPIEILPPDEPRSRAQKTALVVSICSNLALLGFFKYFNFTLDNYHVLVEALGLPQAHLDNVMRVVLPLGISFYTFQSMSYSIDVYRGEAKAMRSFVDFACFVSMFPQLVAGPIIRFSEVADQLAYRTYTLDKFARGVAFFALGMSKKIMLANPCGKVADLAFGADSLHTADAWLGALAYAFQIYFDFSGYTDMAIGLGLMLGFVFPKNFDRPYISASITEFWRRWHISLSSWLRDYLYIPLGGNRKGTTRTYINLMLVMLLGGLWHGASWNFVIWGGIHGGVLAFERAQGKTGFYAKLPRVLRVGATFLIVLISWIFFRSPDLPHALEYLSRMTGMQPAPEAAASLLTGIFYKPYYLLCLMISTIVVWMCPDTWEWTQRLTWRKALICAILLWLAIALLITQSYNPFIYFIF